MIALVLGGARSGKSVIAEELAASTDAHVTYVATVRVDGDVDLANRIALHRSRRPSAWTTLEDYDDLVSVLDTTRGTVLIDSLGPWLAKLPGMNPDAEGLCAALQRRAGDTVVVTDEVGMGVHPTSQLGREFRDALGALNQAVAQVADKVLFVVAGLVLPLGPGLQR
jgi:adenosyl cobinamide kinase/adenosyl cobinamide phosphate guanylyltransferase